MSDRKHFYHNPDLLSATTYISDTRIQPWLRTAVRASSECRVMMFYLTELMNTGRR